MSPALVAQAASLAPVADEQFVLGLSLRDNAVFPNMQPLGVNHFTDLLHQEIYTAIRNLIGRGLVADVLTVPEAMAADGYAEDIADLRRYLAQLEQGAPDPKHAQFYAARLRKRADDRMQDRQRERVVDIMHRERDFEAAVAQVRKVLDGSSRHRAGPTSTVGEYDGIDAAVLVCSDMPEPKFIVEPWLCEGVTLVVGRPKIGKTTLLRQLAVAANTGGAFLGARCKRCRVLFLQLEEGDRLMRSKLKRMRVQEDALRGIELQFRWPQGEVGVDLLRQWLEGAIDSGERVLIVIDSLARFRTPPDQRANAYMQDYEAVRGLADLCKDYPGLAIVVLHHTTKAVLDDPVACISGTYGLTAAAENYLILLAQGSRFRLHAGGRTWMADTSDFELLRDQSPLSPWKLGQPWDTDVVTLPPKQAAVLDALRSGAKTPKSIAEQLGMAASGVSHHLNELASKGLIERIANGWILASREPASSLSTLQSLHYSTEDSEQDEEAEQ